MPVELSDKKTKTTRHDVINLVESAFELFSKIAAKLPKSAIQAQTD